MQLQAVRVFLAGEPATLPTSPSLVHFPYPFGQGMSAWQVSRTAVIYSRISPEVLPYAAGEREGYSSEARTEGLPVTEARLLRKFS